MEQLTYPFLGCQISCPSEELFTESRNNSWLICIAHNTEKHRKSEIRSDLFVCTHMDKQSLTNKADSS